MVETSEISVQTDLLNDYISQKKEYNRIHSKKYWNSHKEIHIKRVSDYKKKKINANDDTFIQKIREQNKKQYLKKKANGITPEEKAKKAAYMKEYRARKKLEKEVSKNV